MPIPTCNSNLWVIGGGQVVFNAKLFHQFTIQKILQLFALITSDHSRKTHCHEQLKKKEKCEHNMKKLKP